MEKYKFLIFFLMMALFWVGCYEDKGNYDYHELLDIQIEGISSSYDKLLLVDTLVIHPQIKPADKEYEYCWMLSSNVVSGAIQVIDTISFEKDLKLKIDLPPSQSYNLIFSAKEKKTGITAYKTSTINVGTEISTGWYVLKEDNGNTELDVFTKYRKVENLIYLSNEYHMPGKPGTLYFTDKYYAAPNSSGRYIQTRCMFVTSDSEIIVISTADGKSLRSFDNMFLIPQEKKPANVFEGYSISTVLLNNGKIYNLNNQSPNTGKFATPLSGNYKISPIKLAVGTSGNPILWDEQSSSFCFIRSGMFMNVFSGIYPETNLNADLLFMGMTGWAGFVPKYAYALLKKKDENSYLLRKMQSSIDLGQNLTQNEDTLDQTYKITSAELWATSLVYDIIYFAKDDKVYSYTASTKTETPLNLSIGTGEEITFMQNLKFLPYDPDNILEDSDKFDYMAIATHSEGNYKLYLFSMAAGSLNTQPDVIMEGKGKVAKAMYITDGQIANSWYTSLY